MTQTQTDTNIIDSVESQIDDLQIRSIKPADESTQSSEPLLGVKFSFFEQFMKDHGGREAFRDKTTAVINRAVMTPVCVQGDASMCQQLLRANSPFVGKPTWFISHA